MTTSPPDTLLRRTPVGDRAVSTARLLGCGYRPDRFEVLVFGADGADPVLGDVFDTDTDALAHHDALVAQLGEVSRDPRQDPRPGDVVRIPGWPVLTVDAVRPRGGWSEWSDELVSASGAGVRLGWSLTDWRRIAGRGEVVCLAGHGRMVARVVAEVSRG